MGLGFNLGNSSWQQHQSKEQRAPRCSPGCGQLSARLGRSSQSPWTPRAVPDNSQGSVLCSEEEECPFHPHLITFLCSSGKNACA